MNGLFDFVSLSHVSYLDLLPCPPDIEYQRMLGFLIMQDRMTSIGVTSAVETKQADIKTFWVILESKIRMIVMRTLKHSVL